MELTKEELQKRIDLFRNVARCMRRKELKLYCLGKADAYIDLYNELYPEMEGKRAFPLKEE